MSKKTLRVLSLLLAICMVAGMLEAPIGLLSVNAVDDPPTLTIPTATTEYVNNTFENETDDDGFTFDSGNSNNIAAVDGVNGHIYLEKNDAADPQVVRTLTEDEVTPYLVVEAALASTKLSGAALKLTGTSEPLSFVDVAADGKITSFGEDTGKTVAADGTYVTVTVSVDAAANTYSLWIGGEQVVQNVAIPTEAFGNVTAVSIELNGENTDAANLIVDDVKIYRYESAIYYNDFNTDADGFTFRTDFTGTSGVQYSEHKLDTETDEGYLYLRAHSYNSAIAWWNNGENAVTLSDQFVVSFDHAAVTKWANFWLSLVDEDGDKISVLWQQNNYAYLKYVHLNDSNGTAYTTACSLPVSTADAMTWRNVTVAFDMTNKTYSLWVENKDGTGTNDYLDIKLADPNNNFGTVQYIEFSSRGDNTTDGSAAPNYCIDNFTVYEGTAARAVTADVAAATAIPAVDESYVDNSFEADDLSGLVLNANNDANKAMALVGNHYLYLEQNDNTGKNQNQPRADYDISFVDSHYIVISMDIATTKGAGPLYVAASDGTNWTKNLIRINENGEIMTSDSSLSTKCYIPTDGQFVHFDVVIDTEANTYSFWYNGQAWGSIGGQTDTVRSLNGTTDFGMLKALRFTYGWTKDKNSMIDNIRIYSYEEDPTPSEPAPSESTPSEPAPSEPAPSEPTPSEPSDVGDKVYYNNDFSENADGMSFAVLNSSAANNNIAVYKDGHVYLERDGSGQPSAFWNKGDDDKGVLSMSDYIVFSADISTTSLGETYIQLYGENNGSTGLLRIEPSGLLRFYYRTETGGVALYNVSNSFTPGTPIKLDIALNIKDRTYSAWVDGEKVVDNLRSLMADDFGSLQYIRWYVHNSKLADGSTGVTNLTIDNLQVYDGIAPKAEVGDVTETPGGTPPGGPEDPAGVGDKVYYNNDFSENADGMSFAVLNSSAANNNIAVYKDGHVYLERDGSGQPSAFWNKGVGNSGVLVLSDYIVFSSEISTTSLGETYIQLYGENNGSTGLLRIEPSGMLRFYYRTETGGTALYNVSDRFAAGTTIQLDIALNIKDRTYSAWVDGEKVVDNLRSLMADDFGRLQYIRWYVHNSKLADGSTGVTNLTIDNLKVYDGVEPKDDVGDVNAKDEFERPDVDPGNGRYYENDFEAQKKDELVFMGGSEIRQDTDGNHYVAIIPSARLLWNYYQKWDPSAYVVYEFDVASSEHGSVLFQMISDKGSQNYFLRWRDDNSTTPSHSATAAKLARGEYVNMAFAINAVDNTYSVWFDGEVVVSNEMLPANGWGELSSTRFEMTTGSATALVKLDNLKVYQGLSPDDYANTVQLTEQPRDESWLEGVFGNPSEIIEYGTEARKVIDAAGATMVNTDSLYVYMNGQRTQGTQAQVDALLANTSGKTVIKNDLGLVIISSSELILTQAQIDALHDYMLYTRPLGADLKNLFNQVSNAEHPRIILNQAKIDRIRSDYKNNDLVKGWTDSIISKADMYIKSRNLTITDTATAANAETIRNRSLTLSLAYLLTSNASYKDFLWKDLETASKWPNWGHLSSWLYTADCAYGFAVAYDWLYDSWTADQRKVMEEAIYKHVFYHQTEHVYGKKTTGNATFFLSETNRNAVTNGGLGMAALAVFEVYPDKCADLLEKTYHMLEYMMGEFAPDGANLEGPAYWEYQMNYLAPFMQSTQLTFGSDFNILKAPGFASTGDFYLDIDGMTGVNNFHDATGSTHGTAGTLFWFANTMGRNDLTEALLAKMDLYDIKGDIYSLIYYNSDIKPTLTVNKPLDAYYRGIEMISLRSSWLNSAGVYASLHSGAHTGASHDHVDAGTFVLDIGGQRFAGDYGKESYDLRAVGEMRHYYYRIRPEGHNVFVINPDKTGEDIGMKHATSIISEFVSKDRGAYTIVSLDKNYAGYAQSATRGMMLGDDRNSVLIRDEIRGMTQDENEVWWFMQMQDVEVEISADGKSAILTKNGVNVHVMVASDNATDWEIKVLEPKEMYPKAGLVDQDKQNANTGWSRLAIVFKAGKDLNINVKFAEVDNPKGDTPIENVSLANWSIPDGELKPNPTLYSIKIGDEELPDFKSNKTAYNYVLPFGTKECPDVKVTGGEGCDIEITKPKKLPGYLKITVTGKNDKELQTSYKIYLTVSGPISVDVSQTPEAENRGSNMVDGKMATKWAASGAAWAVFTFATPTEVDAFWLATMEMNARTLPFTLEVSADGVNFTKVLEAETTMRDGPDALQEFKIPAGTYKAIRINVNGSKYPDGRDYSWISIWEVVFYNQGAPIVIKTSTGEVVVTPDVNDIVNPNNPNNPDNNTNDDPSKNPSNDPNKGDNNETLDPNNPNSNQPGSDNNKGSNAGTIWLIVGISVAAILVAGAIVILLLKKKNAKAAEAAMEEPAEASANNETN